MNVLSSKDCLRADNVHDNADLHCAAFVRVSVCVNVLTGKSIGLDHLSALQSKIHIDQMDLLSGGAGIYSHIIFCRDNNPAFSCVPHRVYRPLDES